MWAAWTDRATLFLILFAALLISDFLDGLLARLLHQRTALGSQLDTTGDVLMCICAIAGGWRLWPERVQNEVLLFASVLGLLALSGIITLLRYRHLPSYHTWSAKLFTALAGIGVWILFAGLTPWVFRLSIFVLTYSAFEEILITLLLPEWEPDIPTAYHALRYRRNARSTRALS